MVDVMLAQYTPFHVLQIHFELVLLKCVVAVELSDCSLFNSRLLSHMHVSGSSNYCRRHSIIYFI
jgi:hypothetical protein